MLKKSSAKPTLPAGEQALFGLLSNIRPHPRNPQFPDDEFRFLGGLFSCDGKRAQKKPT